MPKNKHLDGQLYFGPDGEYEIEPCILEVKEVYENVTVEISECPICHKTSIGWYRQQNTKKIK